MGEEIRASSLDGFVGLVRELGGDPAALLLEVGLDEETIADRDTYIAYATLARLLERAATALERPDFGLRLSRRQGIEILGPVAVVARHSSSVDDAFTRIINYLHVYSSAIALSIEPAGVAEARISFSIIAPGRFPRAQVFELSVGTTVRIVRVLIGPRFRPLRVAIPHAPISAPRVYREHFDAEVQFEQDRCGFDFPAELLATPLRRSDPEVRDLAVRFLDSYEGAGPHDIEERVRHLVTRLLPTGHCTLPTVAAHLGVHDRTLQRRLAVAGTGFEGLVEEVRRERARHYIASSELQMSQIAATLGYSEQSTLSRSCRRWFGESPRALRARARAAARR